jgi:hypothetical protein
MFRNLLKRRTGMWSINLHQIPAQQTRFTQGPPETGKIDQIEDVFLAGEKLDCKAPEALYHRVRIGHRNGPGHDRLDKKIAEDS